MMRQQSTGLDLTPGCQHQRTYFDSNPAGLTLDHEYFINDEDILGSLHPTPALGGTPRKQALEAICKLEGFSRGWYGAPIGFVGLDWAEFVVGIRSGFLRAKRLSVFAGAGIVQGSEALSEWDEVENKISNFIKIIQ